MVPNLRDHQRGRRKKILAVRQMSAAATPQSILKYRQALGERRAHLAGCLLVDSGVADWYGALHAADLLDVKKLTGYDDDKCLTWAQTMPRPTASDAGTKAMKALLGGASVRTQAHARPPSTAHACEPP